MPPAMAQAIKQLFAQQDVITQLQKQVALLKKQYPQPTAAQAQMMQDLTDRCNQAVEIHNQLSANLDQMFAQARPQTQPAAAPPVVPPVRITLPDDSPQVKAALQAVADAKSAYDSLKLKLLAPVYDTAQYKQAKAALDAAQADLARAQAAGTKPSDDRVVPLAQKALAQENLITGLEQQALNASADWKAASAKLQAATQALAAARINPAAEQARQQEQADDYARQQQMSVRQKQEWRVPA